MMRDGFEGEEVGDFGMFVEFFWCPFFVWVCMAYIECREGFLEGNEISMRGISGYYHVINWLGF